MAERGKKEGKLITGAHRMPGTGSDTSSVNTRNQVLLGVVGALEINLKALCVRKDGASRAPDKLGLKRAWEELLSSPTWVR